MTFIKKLDRFILGKFLLIFVGAFFICLFVFMMQSTWKFVDELIGKGLTIDVMARFFYYMGVALMPMALPLSVLLASLITFGNMGEQLELLAMKAAGVSLFRIMRPILFVVAFLTGTSLYFQNTVSPAAQLQMRTLLFSIKASSPAVDIPEGVFYSEIPNVNLYVQEKNAETGMLYQMILYKTDQGFDRAQIVLADSGRIEITADKQHLRLRLWQGEMFENLQGQNMAGLQASSVPYDRETFLTKDILIDFDTNFAEMDANQLSGMAQAKNWAQIEHSVDSMNHELDSLGRTFYKTLRQNTFRTLGVNRAAKTAPKDTITFDKILESVSPDQRRILSQQALFSVQQGKSELEFRRDMAEDTEGLVRRHWIEWHQKFTLALACLVFFFVGAPLGAIIRKGGLGMPTVVSVGIFIIYYIINTSSMKLARDGTINIPFGIWLSTAILTPLGVWLTYKSNRDSAAFNVDAWTSAFRYVLGLRSKRYVARKEVIIHDPDYEEAVARAEAVRTAAKALQESVGKRIAPSYKRLYFSPPAEDGVTPLAQEIDALVSELSNSQSDIILGLINQYPILFKASHRLVSRSATVRRTLGILFPLGIVMWLRACRFQWLLRRDLKAIECTTDQLLPQLRKLARKDNEPNTQS